MQTVKMATASNKHKNRPPYNDLIIAYASRYKAIASSTVINKCHKETWHHYSVTALQSDSATKACQSDLFYGIIYG